MEIQSGVEMSGPKENKGSAGKPSLKELNQDPVRQAWTMPNGLKAQIAETLEVFGVESVLKKGESVNLVEQGGNQLLKSGVINNITLGKETGTASVQGSNLVGNNNILETWKDAGSEVPRKIVMDFSKSAAQRHEESLKPGQYIDLTA